MHTIYVPRGINGLRQKLAADGRLDPEFGPRLIWWAEVNCAGVPVLPGEIKDRVLWLVNNADFATVSGAAINAVNYHVRHGTVKCDEVQLLFETKGGDWTEVRLDTRGDFIEPLPFDNMSEDPTSLQFHFLFH